MKAIDAVNGRPGTRVALASMAQDEEHTRKQRKREAKLRRDAQRPPDSFERFKILSEVIEEGRRVVDLLDHRARYAMVVMGAIHGVLFLLGSRTAGVAELPETARAWVLALLMAYAAATLVFVLAAIESLRPRMLRNGEHSGLLHWEWVLQHDITEYQKAWADVRMEQINREAVLIAHLLARVIQRKYRALACLYQGLALLIVLGALLLTTLAIFAAA